MLAGRVGRWAIVLTGIALVAALPAVIGALPASGSSVGAGQLLARVQGSASVGYSGYAESTGSLDLPVTSGQLGSVADLFGSSTQLRVWWRGDRDWRVDQLTAGGETDLHQGAAGLWTWNFEANTATLDQTSVAVNARLPRADDLVPASLARRLLSQATAGEVQRLGSKRVAGQDAAGLRYTPVAAQSTIDHVDVWALPGSGLAVDVAVYGVGDPTAVVSTTMLDVSVGTPSPSTTAFSPPAGATKRTETAPDLLALAQRITGAVAPDQLAGLPRDPVVPATSSVWVYGAGVTLVVAVPVFGRTGDQLRDQLGKAVGSTVGDDGVAASVGPVNLLIAPRGGGGSRSPSWLLVGTVTPPTLVAAQHDLLAAAGRP